MRLLLCIAMLRRVSGQTARRDGWMDWTQAIALIRTLHGIEAESLESAFALLRRRRHHIAAVRPWAASLSAGLRLHVTNEVFRIVIR